MDDASQRQRLTMQLQILSDFFHKHDRSCIANLAQIVDERRAGAPALSQEAFQLICEECRRRYGEHPLQLHLKNAAMTQCSRASGEVDPAQLAILVAFYRRHDSSRTLEDTRQLLLRRQGSLSALSAADFEELCRKLTEKCACARCCGGF